MNSTAKKITATAFMALFLTATGSGVASAGPKCPDRENMTMYKGECISDAEAERVKGGKNAH